MKAEILHGVENTSRTIQANEAIYQSVMKFNELI